MNVACPECSTIYRIDPKQLPAVGALTRCRECEGVFRVDPRTPERPGEVTTAEPAEAPASMPGGGAAGGEAEPGPEAERGPETEQGPEPGVTDTPASAPAGPPDTEPSPPAEDTRTAVPAAPPQAPVFGPQDPDTRARRLARALVSDIKVYNPDKWEESLEEGTLRSEFRDEILKSWEEYVEQVGDAMAKKTPYFRDALNDILAAGDRVF